MWQGKDMTGAMYCATPGTVPSDLPFVPQSFSVPPGLSMDLVGVSAAGSRHIQVSTDSTAVKANTVAGMMLQEPCHRLLWRAMWLLPPL